MNLALINTHKGQGIFDGIKSQLHVEVHSWDEAFASNKSFIEPWKQPVKYTEFWEDYANQPFEKMVDKYCHYDKKAERRKCQEAWKRVHGYFLPSFLRDVLVKIKKKLRR